MDDGLMDLARRLVESPRWRWMPGMVDAHGRRVVAVNSGPNEGIPVEWSDEQDAKMIERYERPDTARADWSDARPDLTDPATLGCLLAMVGEAWGSDHDVSRFATHTERGVEIWHRLERMDLNGWSSLVTVPVTVGETRFIGGATLAAALVDALLHAPVPS